MLTVKNVFKRTTVQHISKITYVK